MDFTVWFAGGAALSFAFGASARTCLAISVREVGRRGRGAMLPSVLGSVLADLTPLGVLVAVVRSDPRLFPAGGTAAYTFCALGAAVLLLYGFGLTARKINGTLHRAAGEELDRDRGGSLLLDQYLATLLTPVRLSFWVTAGMYLVITASASGLSSLVGLGAGLLLVPAAWHGFVLVRLSGGRRERVLSDRKYRVVLSLSGLCLVLAGFRLAAAVVGASGLRGELERAVAWMFG